MELAGKLLLGFFIGFLCGLIPFIHGLLIKRTVPAIIGLGACSVTGLIFNLLDKSPFTAIVVALMFIVINIAIQKKNKKFYQQEQSQDIK